jgi:hypothetical protein
MSVDEFEDRGIGQSSTLAHGLEAKPGARPSHVMDHRGHDSRAASTKWVTKCDGAANID